MNRRVRNRTHGGVGGRRAQARLLPDCNHGGSGRKHSGGSVSASFKAQKALSGKLTNGKVGTAGMGCLSSQYDAHAHLVLDLPKLAKAVGPANMLAAFNEREKVQFKEMGGR